MAPGTRPSRPASKKAFFQLCTVCSSTPGTAGRLGCRPLPAATPTTPPAACAQDSDSTAWSSSSPCNGSNLDRSKKLTQDTRESS